MAQITAGIVQPPAVASTEAQAKASAPAGMFPVTSHTSPHRSEAHGTQSHLEGDVLKTMEPVTGLEVTISVPPRGVQQAVPLAPLLRATDRPRWRVHGRSAISVRSDRSRSGGTCPDLLEQSGPSAASRHCEGGLHVQVAGSALTIIRSHGSGCDQLLDDGEGHCELPGRVETKPASVSKVR